VTVEGLSGVRGAVAAHACFRANQSTQENAVLNQGALTGITVLDLSRLLPGPYCSMILADHGARVIAIEDRKQYVKDGLFLPSVQRNKAHICLDLKTQEGREIFFRMVERADVVIEGFRPGVVERLGVDYASVYKVRPEIVYCSISGFGQSGPWRDRAGHDVNYLGDSGVLDLIGEAGGKPVIPGVQIADMAGGGMNAAIGILLALYARQRTGRGQRIDISMTDGMLALLPVAKYYHEQTGATPPRGRNLLAHGYACYNTYETADGRFVAVGALEGRFWKALCGRLGLAQYADLQFDEGRSPEIVAALATVFKQKPLNAWEAELGGLDLCVSGIRTMDEALAADHFRQREMVVDLPRPEGGCDTELGVAVKLSATPGALRTPRPRFGQDTQVVLREFGYSTDQIRRWADQGVIG
jgi:crotonobetainyl-CoA:carnitine CoA-transferase CaiB-like acyl-CoA transferase